MIRRAFKRLVRLARASIVYLSLGGSVIALACWSQAARADINLIEAFLKSHDFDCLDLWFQGFCVFFVVKITLLGPQFSVEFTPRISHRNPDVLVSVTGRLGNSPSNEIMLLYNRLEMIISKPIVELLNGQDVPRVYFDPGETSAKASRNSRSGATSSYNYSEVVIVGAPGNVFTLHAEGLGGLSEIPLNALDGATSTIQDAVNLPSVVQDTVTAVAPITENNVDDLSESANATGGTAGFLGQWLESDFQPTQFAQYVLGADTVEYLGHAADLYNSLDANDFDISETVDLALVNAENDINDAVAEVDEIMGDINEYLDDSGVADAAVEEVESNPVDPNLSEAEISEVISTLTGELLSMSIQEIAEELNESIEEAQERVAELLESVEEIQTLIEDFSNQGGGIKVHSFKSFCPREIDIFKPYFASGTDVIGWRWRLPELVFPETYYPAINVRRKPDEPIIDTTKFNVGTYEFGGSDLFGADITFPVYNHWGPIYPRAGGVLQADVTKARAVAASRAMHIITRSGQVHIYNQLPTGLRGSKRKRWHYVTFPGPFNPQDESTGSWQLLDGGIGGGEHSCMRFGDVDDLLPTVTVNETTAINDEGEEVPQFSFATNSYSNVASSEESRLLYNVWRKYDCCQDPKPKNGWSKHMFNIEIELEIPL